MIECTQRTVRNRVAKVFVEPECTGAIMKPVIWIASGVRL